MRRARVTQTAAIMKNSAMPFKSLHESMADHVISPLAQRLGQPLACAYHGEALEGAVRVRYTSTLPNLRERVALKHKFYFPLLQEMREKAFVVTPEDPQATSEIIIHLGGKKRGYFNVGIYDSDHYLLASDVLVYGTNPPLSPYPRKAEFMSPIVVSDAQLQELRDESGRRRLRFTLHLDPSTEDRSFTFGWNATGIYREERRHVPPGESTFYTELLLDENPDLVAGDWIIGAGDAQMRMMAEAMIHVEADGAGG